MLTGPQRGRCQGRAAPSAARAALTREAERRACARRPRGRARPLSSIGRHLSMMPVSPTMQGRSNARETGEAAPFSFGSRTPRPACAPAQEPRPSRPPCRRFSKHARSSPMRQARVATSRPPVRSSIRRLALQRSARMRRNGGAESPGSRSDIRVPSSYDSFSYRPPPRCAPRASRRPPATCMRPRRWRGRSCEKGWSGQRR